MNDLEGLLTSDYGFKPSGKSAPMSSSSSSSSSSTKPRSFDLGSHPTRNSNSFSDDSIFGPSKNQDMFGGKAFDLDSSSFSAKVTDSGPVYDDDIFDGVKSSASDVFSSVTSPPSQASNSNSNAFDDLLGGFGKPESSSGSRGKAAADMAAFDDLIPGFGTERLKSEANWPRGTTANVTKTTSKGTEDLFGVSGQFDPLEEISRLSNSGSLKVDNSSVDNGRAFDDIDPFDGLGKSVPAFSSGRSYKGNDSSNPRAATSSNNDRASTGKESTDKSSVRSPDNQSQKKVPVTNPWDSHETLFDMPSVSTDSRKSANHNMFPPAFVNAKEENVQSDRSPRPDETNLSDIWLTVSEIPLMTQPTSAPPPSRPPPPKPVQVSKARMGSPVSTNARKKASESSTQFFEPPKSAPSAARGSGVSSPTDELDDFGMGKSQSNFDEPANGLSGEELEMNSVANMMKEAMDRAEAKFRHAKEVRERGSTKAARSKEAQERENERLQRESEEEDIEHRRMEKERETERVLEEKEREQRKLEKERERTREMERERDRARQAVERATREARERAAAEARLKAEKAKAERAAVDRANAEARERAERAAVQRAQNEARERAAAEAKGRAEKAATEARERANAEAKEREARERTATARAERAAAERATAEARERAAAAARANQQKNENDLENFFNMGRASSAPRPRSNSSDHFDAHFPNRQEPEVPKTSSTTTNLKKSISTTNIVEDLSSIFGAAPSSGDFQEVQGESEERRRIRLERHRRTQERTVIALREKNQRDLQVQREQAERHRIAETLDVEIKRWAAGKEGNLRALLSTMQYVLWPECGWQPVSLTDMITAAQVKKAYRKATLCIHPDKVQQKGANLQQKYVAEKVFDLCKEAWNKFNSEELF